MVTFKTFYLGQLIRYFKGKDYDIVQNWRAAYEYAQEKMMWAVIHKIPMFSPAAYTAPLAISWFDKLGYDRSYYFFLDNMMIAMLRAAGELVWLMPHNWYESEGCKLEVKEALEHNEKVLYSEPFFDIMKEVELDFDELHLWLELDKKDIEGDEK